MVVEEKSLSAFEEQVIEAYALDRVVAREFLALGIAVEDVPELLDHGVSSGNAQPFVAFGFREKSDVISLVEKGADALDAVQKFRAQGIVSTHTLRCLVEKGITPQETAPFTRLGIVHFLDDLIQLRMRPERVAEYAQLGIEQVGVIIELDGCGITPNNLKEYVDYVESGDNLELVWRDVIRFIKESVPPEVVRLYRARGIPTYQIIDAAREKIASSDFDEYTRAGFNPNKINLVRMIAKRVRVELLQKYRAEGIRESLIDDFIDANIDPVCAGAYVRVGIHLPFEMQALVDAHVPPAQISALRTVGVKVDSVHRLASASVRVETAREFVAQGINSLFDIVVCSSNNVSSDVAAQYKTSFGDVHVNVVDFVKYGVSPDEFHAWEATLSRPEAVYMRDDARLELLARRRFLPVLKREFFIDERTYSRYSFEVLEQLYRLSQEGVDACKPVALVLRPKLDWNGAFGQRFFRDDIVHQALEHANVVLYEIDKASSVPVLIRQCAERYGLIGLLLFAGHGSRTSIKLGQGKEGVFGVESVKALRGLESCLAFDASIILQSCSTGQKGGMAQKLSKALHRRVYAPVAPSQLKEIGYDASGKVDYVRYVGDGRVYVPRNIPHLGRMVTAGYQLVRHTMEKLRL